MIVRPQARATTVLRGSVAGTSPAAMGATPRNARVVAMVLAVNWPPQAPAPGQARSSSARRSLSLMVPAAWAPTASNTSRMVTSRPWKRPGKMGPPYSTRPGRSRRARAMTAAGMVLSQPTSITDASNRWPMTASSIESAMTSRDTSDACIPSVPMVTPSDTEMVLNSMGVPPASRMPSLTAWARLRRCRLHGMTSVQVDTTATSGRSRSASLRPVALSMARAGARAGPATSARLRRGPWGVGMGQRLQKRRSPATESGAGLLERESLLRATARAGRE